MGRGFRPRSLGEQQPEAPESAQKVQADLKAVGIPVRIKASDFATFLQALQGTPETPERLSSTATAGTRTILIRRLPLLASALCNAGPAGNIGRYSNRRWTPSWTRPDSMVRMEERIPLYARRSASRWKRTRLGSFSPINTQRVLIKPYVKGVVFPPARKLPDSPSIASGSSPRARREEPR
jgi:ABC-type transport system substrate-binding protein